MANQSCIYCGKKAASTKDHVPPKSFFPKPRPTNLITVPSCEKCNRNYGKDDERVRNIITSIDTTEVHPAIQQQIAKKRERSYSRTEGWSNVQHLLASIRIADCYSVSGAYLGKAPAFDLDQEIIDRFIERMMRALLFYENGIEYTELQIKWKKSLDIKEVPSELRSFLLNGQVKAIGDGVFTYVGYYIPGSANSLWLMNFYEGFELMSLVRRIDEIDQEPS